MGVRTVLVRMSLPSHPLPQLEADNLQGTAHFLRAIQALGQQQNLVLRDAIYTANGVRLADKGMRIDAVLYDKLVNERLRLPIDDLLEIRDRVDVPTLEAEAMTLCESAALPRLLMQALGPRQQWRLLAPLADMAWPAQACFKLTVMRSQRPQLYEHSLCMMLVAVFLGVRESLDDTQLAQLAAAALLHDVGMLFMEPSWADPQHKLTPEERRQLAVHSITAMLVVRSTAAYPAAVELAVLEHHERMDGSGYPRNITGEQISPLGRILMVAEVVAAFFEKYAGDRPAMRLSLMLRLNRERFDTRLIEHVHLLLQPALEREPRMAAEGEMQPMAAEVRHSLVMLTMLIDHWKRRSAQLPEKWQLLPSGRAGLFLDVRVAGLEAALAEAGSLPKQQMAVLHLMKRDATMLSEQAVINREALWQLETFIHTCLRRWPKVAQQGDAVAQAVMDWINQAQSVLAGKRPGGRPAFFG